MSDTMTKRSRDRRRAFRIMNRILNQAAKSIRLAIDSEGDEIKGVYHHPMGFLSHTDYFDRENERSFQMPNLFDFLPRHQFTAKRDIIVINTQV